MPSLRDRGIATDLIAGAMLFFETDDFAGTATVRATGPEIVILHGPMVRATPCASTPGMTEEPG